jgi:hypothetical protein
LYCVLPQLGSATDPQIARSVFLRIFNQSQIFLLVGAAITTVGLLAGGFALLRRRLDRLLLWFAAFAILYGVFLVAEYQPLWGLGVKAPIFSRIALAVGLLVPIPGFFFFDALKLLGRLGRILRDAIWPITASLALATLVLGYKAWIDRVNNIVVIAALLVLAVALLRMRQGGRDVLTVRWGVFFFCACAVYNNTLAFSRVISTSSPSVFWSCLLAWAQSRGAGLWLKSRNSATFKRNSRSHAAFSSRSFRDRFRIRPAFALLSGIFQ